LINHHNIYPCGDHAITISFGNTIDIATNEKVMALFYEFIAAGIYGVKDIIPAYASLTVVYDIQKIKQQTNHTAYEFMCSKTEAVLKNLTAKPAAKHCIEIPVCYDISFGTDLPAIAQQKQISIEEIIQIHTSVQYHVYMIGFLPGFAYMGIVDERIAIPRLVQPRTNVAAGSVGIAGNQTGVYPLESPGGWNIIGRTPLTMFDANKESPCLLQPGNTIQFVSVTKEAFEKIKKQYESPHY
jgi:inhibitor of KinA